MSEKYGGSALGAVTKAPETRWTLAIAVIAGQDHDFSICRRHSRHPLWFGRRRCGNFSGPAARLASRGL
jgi:hypothetical protein